MPIAHLSGAVHLTLVRFLLTAIMATSTLNTAKACSLCSALQNELDCSKCLKIAEESPEISQSEKMAIRKNTRARQNAYKELTMQERVEYAKAKLKTKSKKGPLTKTERQSVRKMIKLTKEKQGIRTKSGKSILSRAHHKLELKIKAKQTYRSRNTHSHIQQATKSLHRSASSNQSIPVQT